jgi:hypothetical protein
VSVGREGCRSQGVRLSEGHEFSESCGEGLTTQGQWWKARLNRDTTLFHHTVVAKVLGEALTVLALRSIGDRDGASEARHQAALQLMCPPKRVRRGVTVFSLSQSRLGTGGSSPTRCGCPSLKTKSGLHASV